MLYFIYMLLGIDLGGTKIHTALADDKGRIISSVKVETQARLGSKKVIENIMKSVSAALANANTPLSKVKRIGIGAPGPIVDGGVIIAPPNLPWKKFNIKSAFMSKLKKPVFVENDANAAALAESLFGAGVGEKNLVYITVSTGIGGGIILDGKLYRGSIGTAGEIGHMVIDVNGPLCGCGNHGCLETLASGPAIAKMAGKKDALQAELAARKHDKRAAQAIKDAAKSLGIGIANIYNILDPDIVIVGGGVAAMGDLLFKPMREWAKQYTIKARRKTIKILPAKLKTESGVMGALAVAMKGDE